MPPNTSNLAGVSGFPGGINIGNAGLNSGSNASTTGCDITLCSLTTFSLSTTTIAASGVSSGLTYTHSGASSLIPALGNFIGPTYDVITVVTQSALSNYVAIENVTAASGVVTYSLSNRSTGQVVQGSFIGVSSLERSGNGLDRN